MNSMFKGANSYLTKKFLIGTLKMTKNMNNMFKDANII